MFSQGILQTIVRALRRETALPLERDLAASQIRVITIAAATFGTATRW